jgi:hypothetical protein
MVVQRFVQPPDRVAERLLAIGRLPGHRTARRTMIWR